MLDAWKYYRGARSSRAGTSSGVRELGTADQSSSMPCILSGSSQHRTGGVGCIFDEEVR